MPVLYALLDHRLDELIDWYSTIDAAEETLREILSDEPEWQGTLEIVPVTLEASSN
jgi:hypothetical protein